MAVSELLIRLIVLLLPGLVAVILIDQLTEHRDWTPFTYTVYAILLGATAYFAWQVVLYAWAGLAWVVTREFTPVSIAFWESLFDEKKPISWIEIAAASGVAVPLGFGLAAGVYHKALFALAQRLKISNKFGDDSLFMNFMNSREVQWVRVRDRRRGYIFEGWPVSFSHTPGLRELVLQEVKVYNYEKPGEAYEVPLLYLSYSNGQEAFIETATGLQETADGQDSAD